MEKCVVCGEKGLLLKVNAEGLCLQCEKEQAERQRKQQEAARKAEEERKRAQQRPERPTQEERSMAAIAEKMGQLQEYLQEGPHWSGKWDIGKSS